MAAFSKIKVGDTLLIEVEVIDLRPHSDQGKRVKVKVKHDPLSGGEQGWLPDNVLRRATLQPAKS